MKEIIYILFASVCLSACSDLDSIHQEYLDRGEQVYLGKPTAIYTKQGYEKILVKWESNPSHLIKRTVIYWNNRTDSLIQENKTSSGFIKDSVMISDLREGNIEFTIVNQGEDGLYSLPISKTAIVLGKNYVSTLIPRNCTYVMNNEKSELTINWNNVSSQSVYTQVTYTSTDGKKKEIICLTADMTTILADIDKSKGFSYITYYKPENAIEDFPSREKVIDIN